MRYTVLTSRTFHNRITRYLGVLVGAALVATLGLPSAVQAQTTGAPIGDVDDVFTVKPPHGPVTMDHNVWLLGIDGPNGASQMVTGGGSRSSRR